jgi:hypothetical protein
LAKVNVNIDLKIDEIKKKVEKNASRAAAQILKDQILFDIAGGRSPVEGKGRFQKYSKRYIDQIDKDPLFQALGKRKRPVNMKLSGQMLSSLSVDVVGNKLRISFSDEVADYHNRQGAGKSKVIRRLLPTNEGERFNRNIRLAFQSKIGRIIKRIVRSIK